MLPSQRPMPPSRPRALSLRARTITPDAAAIARRRLIIGVLKRALPLAALAVLSLIALWPEITGTEERLRFAYRKPPGGVTESARLVEPRYHGRDERSRPYALTADVAEQRPGSAIVDLLRPRGDITLEDGSWVLLQATAGRFDRERRLLDLAGEVTLFHDAGYEIRTDRARIDLAAGRAEGDDPVAAQGPAGTLDAVGFRLEERGLVAIFPGPARMVLVTAEGTP